MNETEFKKEVLTDVNKVDEEQIKFENETTTEEEKLTTKDNLQEAQEQGAPVTMNLMDFGTIITNVYCGLSDTVYKRIKKTDSAPKWDAETKTAINDALSAYLSTVNVAVKPIYGLIATLATVEVVRYTMPLKLSE